MSTFLLRRGKGSLRRKAHLARYDEFGEIAGAWCHRGGFDVSSNVPWGCRQCKDCLRRMAAARRQS